MSDVRRRTGAQPRPLPPASPFDAQAAVEHLLARLRASAGATRVSVWVHEATTELVAPFRQSVAASGGPVFEHQRLRTAIPLDQTPFLATVIRSRAAAVARADGRRAADREVEGLGIRSAHAEPLILDGEVIGVLTVEPAAAAAPHLLRQLAPKLALATAEAWARRAEKRRTAQAAVLLDLIESASKAQSMDHLLGTACRQLAQLDEVERACILLLEDGRLVPRTAAYADGRRDGAAWEQIHAPVGMHLAETVLRTGEPAAADEDSGLLGVASGLAVPLGRTPDIAGVLTLDSSVVRPFPEDVRRIAVAAGAHLGGVIRQVRTDRTAVVPRPRTEAAGVLSSW